MRRYSKSWRLRKTSVEECWNRHFTLHLAIKRLFLNRYNIMWIGASGGSKVRSESKIRHIHLLYPPPDSFQFIHRDCGMWVWDLDGVFAACAMLFFIQRKGGKSKDATDSKQVPNIDDFQVVKKAGDPGNDKELINTR